MEVKKLQRSGQAHFLAIPEGSLRFWIRSLSLARVLLGLVYTSDGSDGSRVVSGVGIGRKFWSSVNRHNGSGIVSLAFSVSLAFICEHSRWRTREMTRDCCFYHCFLFSYDEEDVCNGTKEGEGCSHYFAPTLRTPAWSWLTNTSNKWNCEVLLV